MRMNLRNIRLRNLFLTMMLIVAMASAAGCGNRTQEADTGQPPAVEAQGQDNVLGEGRTVIQFVVVDQKGSETSFEIHTDKETVGEALLEHDLIAGDAGDYGLYVKQVNGITADYDADQTYWAFYINGEYASSGVDTTPVKEGETYTFKIEK